MNQKLRVLLDTNILIYREDEKEIKKQIQDLFQLLNNTKVLIHPFSIHDIKNDRDETRKKKILSKISVYNKLNSPPRCGNRKNPSAMSNDEIDDQLLCAVRKNAVHFLISNDLGMHSKIDDDSIENRVLQIDEAIDYFSTLFEEIEIQSPTAIEHMPVHNLEVNNSFFNPLREDYEEFDKWFKKIPQLGRKCYFWGDIDNSNYYAICIYKEERERILLNNKKILPEKDRLKISTLLASKTGYKIGELFLRIMFEYAKKKGIKEIYLTHFVKKEFDYLVKLIEEYGFENIGEIGEKGEKIYLKKLDQKPKLDTKNEIKSNLSKIYPYFCDREYFNKFIIPIQPHFHNRLFTDYPGAQPTLDEFFESAVKAEGNTIKKIYISNSNTKQIKKGDLIFFYRSKDKKSLTSFGVVNEVHYNINDPLEVIEKYLKRTVYSETEIIKMINSKNSIVILFTFHSYLNNEIPLEKLLGLKILKSAPQSITNIEHTKYSRIKKEGEINEHYIIN